MRNTSINKHRNFFLLSLLISLLYLFACTPDEEMMNENFGEALSAEEMGFMTKLLQIEAEVENIWTGFNCLRDYPIYILTGTDQGIYINPPTSHLTQSEKIAKGIEGFATLNLYRNDEVLALVKQELAGDRFFAFTQYEGFPLYAYELSQPRTDFYSSYKNRNGHFHASIFYHELFHVYQLIKNNALFLGNNNQQNVTEYPLTEETLPLLILLFDLMMDAYHQDDPAQQLRYLQYYVSILHGLEQIDPTADKLIRRHGFYQEKIEGSARYIEVFATLEALNNNTVDDPSHGFKTFAENATMFSEVRIVYAFRIFYHTGAGALHLLKTLDHPNLEESMLIPTNTPYDIAADFVEMSDSERAQALEEAKMAYDWEAILTRAEFLLELP